MGGQPAKASLSLGASHFREANQRLREALAAADVVELRDVCAQRYLGCAMPAGKKLDVFGTPGNDMACFLDGGEVEVHGSAQDQVGNTMNDGRIVIHGRCGDAAGYAMRGGKIFVRGNAGYRAGIHMKAYKEKKPIMIIGGTAGSFLGEYQAGGVIIVLGLDSKDKRIVGNFPCTGMHGGKMFLRGECNDIEFPKQVTARPADSGDLEELKVYLSEYCEVFGLELSKVLESPFTVVTPDSKNPYKQMYVAN